MANWQRKLDISDEWCKVEDGESTIQELARVIAQRLKALRDFGDECLDERKQETIADFASIADDPQADHGDFVSTMSALYDWADTRLDDGWPGKKACWVETLLYDPPPSRHHLPQQRAGGNT